MSVSNVLCVAFIQDRDVLSDRATSLGLAGERPASARMREFGKGGAL